MVTVGMSPFKATGKRTSPVRSRILPLPILIKEDLAFWWQNLSLSEGLRPTPVGQVESECSPAFRPRETPFSQLAMSFFNVYIMHHDVTSTRSAQH